MSARLRTSVGVALPALLCGLVGVVHPVNLTDDSALLWRNIHVLLIPIFPLIGLAPWLIARRVDRRLGWVGALFGYGYAAFYTSLDLIAGVAAGTVEVAGMSDAKAPLYAIARILGAVGVVSLIAGAVTASIAAVIRAGVIALPGALLAIAGAALLYRGHIYFGYGTLSMLLLAAGFVVLAFAVTETGRPRTALGRRWAESAAS